MAEIRVVRLRVALNHSPKAIAPFLGLVDGKAAFLVDNPEVSVLQNLTVASSSSYNLRKRRRQHDEKTLLCEMKYYKGVCRELQTVILPWEVVKKALNERYTSGFCSATPSLHFEQATKPVLRKFKVEEHELRTGSAISIPIECSVCLEDCYCFLRPQSQRNDNYCILFPCMDLGHAVCVRCLKRMLMNFQNHPLNRHMHGVSCPNVECHSQEIVPIDELMKILNLEEQKQFIEFIRKFENPGVTTFIHVGCGCEVEVSLYEMIEKKTMILQCSHCDESFCYLCQNECSIEDADDGVCIHCGGDPISCLGAFNRFFYRPNKTRYTTAEGLLRNYELTVPLVIEQLEEIVGQEQPAVKCPECGVWCHRTTDCNELQHCTRLCYFCGFKATPLDTHLCHFAEDGCYQFITEHQYLKHCYQCDSACHNHRKVCTVAEHKPGIKMLHRIRKVSMINSRLESLPKLLLKDVLQALLERSSPVLEFIK